MSFIETVQLDDAGESIARFLHDDGEYMLIDIIHYVDTDDEWIINARDVNPYTAKDAYSKLYDMLDRL